MLKELGINAEQIKKEYQECIEKLAYPEINKADREALQKRASELSSFVQEIDLYQEICLEIESTEQMLDLEKDPELVDLARQDLIDLKEKVEQIKKRIIDLLTPPDPTDNKPCFVEIRAGTGGQEASLFVTDLAKMYTSFAQSINLKPSTHSIQTTEVGGARQIILYIEGKQAFGKFKFESGVHRVQRIPATETSGRIHTSTATVAVMPEADEIDVNVNPNDIRIDVYRSSGAGGQSVNTTDSAVRITHIPTGIVVTCQDERSQPKNKAKALKELRSRLLEKEIQEAQDARSKDRKSQIGTGKRSEKIRTYNFPQNRLTDHRVGLTLKKLDLVIQGDLADVISCLEQDLKKKKLGLVESN